jgi:SAM-dependent methyltransferase
MHRAPAAEKRAQSRRGKHAARAGNERKQRRPGAKKSRWRTAATSDRLELYELSVQEPSAECDFIDQVWREKRGRKRKCRSIREDFCGSAIVCAEWVKRHRSNTAVGVDLDANVLNWTRPRLRKRLKPRQLQRLRLLQADVRTAPVKNIDSVLAMNFSHFIFKTRDELRNYYRSVHRSLKKGGIFILDAYGGSESHTEMTEDRNLDSFTYVWDQNQYNPIDNHVINHIHFKFPDGTKIERAFTYDWRLWSLPELREVLLEAGFDSVSVYWEGTEEETGEGDGVWREETRGEACLGWIAYLAAMK